MKKLEKLSAESFNNLIIGYWVNDPDNLKKNENNKIPFLESYNANTLDDENLVIDGLVNKKIIYPSKFKDDESFKKITPTNINQSDSDGYTPLCYAIANGITPHIIVGLINCGASTTQVCDRGISPLQIAVQSVNSDAIKILLRSTEINNPLNFEYPVTDKDGNNIQILKTVDGSSDIEYIDAIGIIDTKTHNIIPKETIDINDYKYVVLNAAALKKPDLLLAIIDSLPTSKQIELTKFSREYISLENNKTKSGGTPLVLACQAQCYDSVRKLCEIIHPELSSFYYHQIYNEKIYGFANAIYEIDALNDKGLPQIFFDTGIIYKDSEFDQDELVNALFDNDIDIITSQLKLLYNSNFVFSGLYNLPHFKGIPEKDNYDLFDVYEYYNDPNNKNYRDRIVDIYNTYYNKFLPTYSNGYVISLPNSIFTFIERGLKNTARFVYFNAPLHYSKFFTNVIHCTFCTYLFSKFIIDYIDSNNIYDMYDNIIDYNIVDDDFSTYLNFIASEVTSREFYEFITNNTVPSVGNSNIKFENINLNNQPCGLKKLFVESINNLNPVERPKIYSTFKECFNKMDSSDRKDLKEFIYNNSYTNVKNYLDQDQPA